jgi:hypothetical protein
MAEMSADLGYELLTSSLWRDEMIRIAEMSANLEYELPAGSTDLWRDEMIHMSPSISYANNMQCGKKTDEKLFQARPYEKTKGIRM